MKKDSLGQLIIAVLLPMAVGLISGAISSNLLAFYEKMDKPILTLPHYIFPIVWTILYLFMGISSFLVFVSHSQCRDLAGTVYGIQLLLNFSFCILTLRFGFLYFGFILSILLLFVVLFMTLLFNKGSKTAALLQLPYLLWLCYVVYLEISILM